MSIDFFGNVIGILGMIFLLIAYYSVQNEKLRPKDIRFIILNLLGAICMLISLYIHFNLASFILECIFSLIGLKALYEHFFIKKKKL